MGKVWAVGAAILVGIGAGLLVTLSGGDDKVPLEGPGAVVDADNDREAKSADGDGNGAGGKSGRQSGEAGGGASGGGSGSGGGSTGGGENDPGLLPDITVPELPIVSTLPSTPLTPITVCYPPVTAPLTGVTLVEGHCIVIG